MIHKLRQHLSGSRTCLRHSDLADVMVLFQGFIFMTGAVLQSLNTLSIFTVVIDISYQYQISQQNLVMR